MSETTAVEAVQEISAPKHQPLWIAVDRDDLLRELHAAKLVVETKTTIPILANILLDSTGEALQITATNLVRTVQTSSRAEIFGQGKVTVPARKLYDYVKLLPPGEIKITQEENGWVKLRAGRSNTKMVGMSSKNYPQIPVYAGEALALPTDTLRTMLSKVALAISEEESRYVLQGALIDLNGKHMRLVATDGHRLAVVEQDTAQDWPETTMLIPGDALDVLRGLLSDFEGPVVSVGQNADCIFFYVGSRTLSTQKLTGNFPNWKAVVPKFTDAGLPLDAATTLGALRRSLTFADGKTSAVKMQITADELTFVSKSQDVGESAEGIEVIGGTEMTAGYNGKYISEFLQLVEETVTLHVKDAQSAALFVERLDTGLEYRYVLMPMRV
jgi:DNA polymerase-3 subunit beta